MGIPHPPRLFDYWVWDSSRTARTRNDGKGRATKKNGTNDLGIVNGMYSNYPALRYNLMFDLNKDGVVDEDDSKLIITKYGGFSSMFYQETWDWMLRY